MSTIRAERSEAVGAGMPPTVRRLLVNTLVTGVTSTSLWFALTFWVYLETRSVVATGVIGGAFNISSAVLGPFFGADLIGSWFGTGPDRGIALMFTLAGLLGGSSPPGRGRPGPAGVWPPPATTVPPSEVGGYVHGYDGREHKRLDDQAGVLAELLHSDTQYEQGSEVLEAGCGTGAQTVILARRSPQARFTSIDVSEQSLAAAADRLNRAGIDNVQLRRADVLDLPFAPAWFDHVFVCFLLEHLSRPVDALAALRRVVRPGGTLTVVEGDARSAFFHPDDPAAHAVIDCLVEIQQKAGGDALIGRRLYPLLVEAGFENVRVSPRFVYADGSRPEMADRFTRRTFTAMIEGVRDASIAAGLIDAAAFDKGIAALRRAAEDDGVFCFTFFKAVAIRGS